MHINLNVFENELSEICHPLFISEPVDFFAFVRVYDKGTCQVLSTSTAIYEHLFKENYRITADIPERVLAESFRYIIPVDGPYHRAMHDLQQYFKLHFPIDFVYRYNGYYEMFCFASAVNSFEIANYYLNNTDKLEKFMDSFKEKAKKLIKHLPKITLNEEMLPTFKGLENETIHYTNRERQCLKYLLQGLTARQIASKLNLSPRTVEQYTLNLKNKHNCKYKSELIEKLLLI